MNLEFDIRGNLKPYRITEISLKSFQKKFVNDFNQHSSRMVLFKNYQKYNNDLRSILTQSFYQWIDGSYVSNKLNPKDIDIVTIVNYQDYEKNKLVLEKEFAAAAARSRYEVDAYIVAKYPRNHKKYIITQSDLLYWQSLFSKTKKYQSFSYLLGTCDRIP